MATSKHIGLIEHLARTGTSARDALALALRQCPEVPYSQIAAAVSICYPGVELPPAPDGEEEEQLQYSDQEELILGGLFKAIVNHLKLGNSFEEALDQVAVLNPGLAPIALKRVQKYLSRTNTWPYGGGLIAPVNPDPNSGWYGGPKSDSSLWYSFKSAIQAEGKLNENDIDVLDDFTTRILSRMPAPGRSSFSGRGLVMGYVQSGKTTNFMGLAAKAADEKYKLIIVLSGITNNLRDQTQSRLETVLTGNNPNWHWLTHKNEDFTTKHNAQSLLGPGNQTRLIAVVKKNTSRLKLLNKWLGSVSDVTRASFSVLVIDDECDQASINTHRQKDARTAVNKALTDLLNPEFLPRASYVGYSATPYANFLIDTTQDEGLYPRDFIVSLNKGLGYFGAAELFGRDALADDDSSVQGVDIIRDIPNVDVESVKPPRGQLGDWLPEIPSSLRDAIGWFVLANSIRVLRSGNQEWSTMMVHTSPNVEPHRRTAQVVRDLLSDWIDDVDGGLEKFLNSLYSQEMSKANELSPENSKPLVWDAVFKKCLETLDTIRVIVDNYKSDDRLDYDNEHPYPVIVVGGNTLARGLTLEGLVSSFFLRTTNAYDALMQMGRWFGFRPGYADLQRIWMPDEDPYKLAHWFRQLAFVEEEIRSQIESYAFEGYTPNEVGIKIRKLPGLAITAAAKQRHAVDAQLSFSGSKIQTILFERDEDVQTKNLSALDEMISEIGRSNFVANSEKWPIAKSVSADIILSFLQKYRFEPGSKALQFDPISTYVNNLRQDGELEEWNVAIYNNQRQSAPELEISQGLKVRMANRAQLKSEKDPKRIDIKTLISVGDMVADKPELKIKHKATYGTNLKQSTLKTIRGADFEVGTVPLLGIYLVDKDSKPSAADSDKRVNLNSSEHLVGLYFIFPETSNSKGAAFITANIEDKAELEEVEPDSEVIDEPEPIDESGASITILETSKQG